MSQPPPKKHKRALSSESTNILQSCLAQMQRMIMVLTSSDELSEIVDTEPLQELSQTLAAKLDGRVTHGFRGLKEVTLEGFDIKAAQYPLLIDKNATTALGEDSAERAKEHIWSSDMLFNHLQMLQNFASPNEAGARLWINAFLFRVNAMFNSPDNGLVLSLEQRLDVTVNPQAVFSGFVDYAVLSGPKAVTGRFFPSSDLTMERNKDSLSLFIDEAKSFLLPLDHYLPQTVGKMYAGMKALRKDFIRGALTNGREWIFIVLEAKDSDGATFHRTPTITLHDTFSMLSKPACDLVAAIIADWVDKSHCTLGDKDVIRWAKDLKVNEPIGMPSGLAG